ncbi:MAG: FAD-binding oxidoreductase, partial [Natronospirillum sp.]
MLSLNPGNHLPSHPASYYMATRNAILDYPTLARTVQTQVCVVGGGYSGVNTALELAERGFDVTLVEARQVGWGASGRNGGQLIRGVGHGTEPFLKYIGAAGVAAINAMGFEAIELVRHRIAQYDIECDLRWGYCDLANKPAHYRAFEREYAQLKAQNYAHELELLPKERMREVVGSDRYCGGLIDWGSGHLHPLNLLLGEVKAATELGVQVFEHSPVERIETLSSGAFNHRVHTAGGAVDCEHLVLCGNAYVAGLDKTLEGKVLPAGSYVIVTEPLRESECQQLLPQNMAVCDQRIDLDYYRLTADRRLLFGGLCNYSGRDPQSITAQLRPNMLRVFPQLKGVGIEFEWGGMIGIGANRMPQIGRLPGGAYYAQAYSGHGLNASHLAAR